MRSVRFIVGLTAAGLLLAAWAAPWMATHGMSVAALVVQSFFHAVCHQKPERSFWFDGHPWAVCVRCSGIYAGLMVGAFLRISTVFAKKVFLVILFLNVADIAMEMMRVHGNSSEFRFVFGLGLGVAVSALLVGRDQQPDWQEKRV